MADSLGWARGTRLSLSKAQSQCHLCLPTSSRRIRTLIFQMAQTGRSLSQPDLPPTLKAKHLRLWTPPFTTITPTSPRGLRPRQVGLFPSFTKGIIHSSILED